MNEPIDTEIWYCEDCHVVQATTVAWEDRDMYSVRYAIERAHRQNSPQCRQPVGWLRVINRAIVKCRADLEADPTVPRWVIAPVMHVLEARADKGPNTHSEEPQTRASESPTVKEEERIRLYVYPSTDVRQLHALKADTRHEAIALYLGKEGNGQTYAVLAAQVESFKHLAQQQYGCIVLSDAQVQLFLREQIW